MLEKSYYRLDNGVIATAKEADSSSATEKVIKTLKELKQGRKAAADERAVLPNKAGKDPIY